MKYNKYKRYILDELRILNKKGIYTIKLDFPKLQKNFKEKIIMETTNYLCGIILWILFFAIIILGETGYLHGPLP